MTKRGTAMCFKSLHQETVATKVLAKRSFEQQMRVEGIGFEL